MIANAKARYIRVSARKVRMVIDLIRGEPTHQALSILQNTSRRVAGVVNKLLRSAIANAKHKGIDEEGLYISKIFANEGPTWKRFRANAFGRGTRIRKRTCHIIVELDQKKIKPKIATSDTGKKRKIIKKPKKVSRPK